MALMLTKRQPPKIIAAKSIDEIYLVLGDENGIIIFEIYPMRPVIFKYTHGIKTIMLFNLITLSEQLWRKMKVRKQALTLENINSSETEN